MKIEYEDAKAAARQAHEIARNNGYGDRWREIRDDFYWRVKSNDEMTEEEKRNAIYTFDRNS